MVGLVAYIFKPQKPSVRINKINAGNLSLISN
jgi:hypothetical protein